MGAVLRYGARARCPSGPLPVGHRAGTLRGCKNGRTPGDELGSPPSLFHAAECRHSTGEAFDCLRKGAPTGKCNSTPHTQSLLSRAPRIPESPRARDLTAAAPALCPRPFSANQSQEVGRSRPQEALQTGRNGGPCHPDSGPPSGPCGGTVEEEFGEGLQQKAGCLASVCIRRKQGPEENSEGGAAPHRNIHQGLPAAPLPNLAEYGSEFTQVRSPQSVPNGVRRNAEPWNTACKPVGSGGAAPGASEPRRRHSLAGGAVFDIGARGRRAVLGGGGLNNVPRPRRPRVSRPVTAATRGRGSRAAEEPAAQTDT